MNKRIQGSVLIFLGAFSFGILATIVKSAFAKGFTAGELMGCQDLLGLIILWLFYFVSKWINKRRRKSGLPMFYDKSKSQPAKRTPWWQFCIAGLLIGLSEIFYYLSLNMLPVSVAIVLLMQYLWISILFESIITRKLPSLMQVICVIVVLGGTCLAGGILSSHITFSWKGAGCSMLAATAYALFLNLSGRIGNEIPTLKKSALLITGSCIVVFIFFPPVFLFNGVLFSLIKWGLALALFAAVLPPILFTEGMPKTGVAIGSIISTAELPIATLSSFVILGEEIVLLQWLGIIAILVAIIVPNIKLLLLRNI